MQVRAGDFGPGREAGLIRALVGAHRRVRAVDWYTGLFRQLSRVSALLEVGNEQFEAVRSASLGLDASHDARARAGELDIPIDASSLPAYVSESAVVSQLVQIAQAIGFTVGREPPSEG